MGGKYFQYFPMFRATVNYGQQNQILSQIRTSYVQSVFRRVFDLILLSVRLELCWVKLAKGQLGIALTNQDFTRRKKHKKAF